MSDLSRKPEFVREVRRLIRREYRRPWWTAWAVLIIVAFAGVAVAVSLFTHTSPGVSYAAPVVATTCTTLYELSQSGGPVGFAAEALFSCKGTVAMTASSTGGSATYAVGLGSWSAVYLYVNGTAPGAQCSGATLLSGTGTFVFAAGTAYNYCAYTVSAQASMGAFTVQWSQ